MLPAEVSFKLIVDFLQRVKDVPRSMNWPLP